VFYSISDKGFRNGSSLLQNLHTMRDAGFTHIHFSHKWTSPEAMAPGEVERWQAALAATGMKVLDAHGTHPGVCNFWSTDAVVRRRAVDLMIHRLEVTRALGGDAVVYHVPEWGECSASMVLGYVDALARLEEIAVGMGVAVALENHYVSELNRRVLTACFERFRPEFVGFTFDTGHGQLAGDSDWLCHNCGDRLRVLHLNDNDGLKDQHWNPRDPRGTVDWAPVVEMVARSSYTKPLQLEVRWDPDMHGTHAAFLTDAFRQTHWLSEQVSQLRRGRAAG